MHLRRAARPPNHQHPGGCSCGRRAGTRSPGVSASPPPELPGCGARAGSSENLSLEKLSGLSALTRRGSFGADPSPVSQRRPKTGEVKRRLHPEKPERRARQYLEARARETPALLGSAWLLSAGWRALPAPSSRAPASQCRGPARSRAKSERAPTPQPSTQEGASPVATCRAAARAAACAPQ